MAGDVRYAVEGGVARLTIDQPEKFNALTLAMWRAIPRHLAIAENDRSVRVVAIEGAGDKAFSAGADISEFGEKRSAGAGAAEYEEAVAAANGALAGIEKPTVALIRGICFGGGLGLAMCCDLRIARADARFRIPAARLGLGYAFANIEALHPKVGVDALAELLFTAKVFDAADGLRLGLATRLIATEAFEAETGALLAGIATNAPLTLRAVKRSLIEVVKAPDARDRSAVEDRVAACFDSADYAEGQAAFREKREPRFRGA